MMRSALASLLDLEDDMSVVATVGSGDEVLAAVRDAGRTSCCSTSSCPGAAAWT